MTAMCAKNDRLLKRFRALRHANGGDRRIAVRYSAENVCAGGNSCGFKGAKGCLTLNRHLRRNIEPSQNWRIDARNLVDSTKALSIASQREAGGRKMGVFCETRCLAMGWRARLSGKQVRLVV
jgi:hypothetical protein